MPRKIERPPERLFGRSFTPTHSRHAIRYIQAAHEAVSTDEWRQICELAKQDALDPESYAKRETGRRWLAKMLLPPDLAVFQQAFMPQLGAQEIRTLMREFKEMSEELAKLKAQAGLQIKDVESESA